jgi:hypothetical protein
VSPLAHHEIVRERLELFGEFEDKFPTTRRGQRKVLSANEGGTGLSILASGVFSGKSNLES